MNHGMFIIPIGHSQNGLPIGLQMVGKHWQEMELLDIAKQIDPILSNFQRPPGY